MASNRAALVGRFCRAARNKLRVQPTRGGQHREVGRVVVGTGHQSDGAREAGLGEHRRIGGVADDHPRFGLGPLDRFDDGDLEPSRAQVRGDLPTEAAVSADHPAAVGRRTAALGQFRARTGLEPGQQLVGRRRVQRQPQMLAESVERVDHGRRPEGPHPFRDRGRDGPGDDGQVGTDQRRRHGDCEVGLVVVGQRQHAGAEGMVETGGAAGAADWRRPPPGQGCRRGRTPGRGRRRGRTTRRSPRAAVRARRRTWPAARPRARSQPPGGTAPAAARPCP